VSTANFVFSAGVQILLLWLSVSAHEAAHAWVASRRGDETARLLGRLSLNPLRHLDFAGSVFLPLTLVAVGLPVLVGWGRPAPVLPQNLRRPGRDDVLVYAAGPLANLMLALLAAVALGVVVAVTGAHATAIDALGDLTGMAAAGKASFPAIFTLMHMATLNSILAAFHLIPLPPLDGGQIALRLFPPDWAAKLATLSLPGLMIGMVLGLFALLPVLLLFRGFLWMVINLS
jgi:Zn-dependent protease